MFLKRHLFCELVGIKWVNRVYTLLQSDRGGNFPLSANSGDIIVKVYSRSAYPHHADWQNRTQMEPYCQPVPTDHQACRLVAVSVKGSRADALSGNVPRGSQVLRFLEITCFEILKVCIRNFLLQGIETLYIKTSNGCNQCSE